MAFITIYDSNPVDRDALTRLLPGTEHRVEFVEGPLTLENVRSDSEVISVFVTSNVSGDLIGRMPKLKLIACRSTGFDNVDLAAAEKQGIVTANVPTYGEHTVAEYMFTLLLALSRKLQAVLASVNAVDVHQEALTGFDLNGKTLGVIGTGRIGQRVIAIAKSFGMKVVAYDPFPNQEAAKELEYSYLNLDDLARQSDIITLHAAFGPGTHHLVGKDFLTKVKRGAILVNTARGGLVDTHALIDALSSGLLGGAALDVLEGEELLKVKEEILLLRQGKDFKELFNKSVQLDVLKRLPNVLISPHNAFNTKEAIQRINETTAQNITQFLDGKPQNQVKPTKPTNGLLIITRHGESEWNAEGKWTGSRDVHLSEKGFKEAAQLGQVLGDQKVDIAFTSQQIRAFETLEGMLNASQQFDVPYERSHALDERNYGDYTGLNKWQIREKLGEEMFQHLRRDWNYPVPHGETLKMVYERAVPYYQQTILPELLAGKNVLVVSHGNAIRALMKYIEKISDEGIASVEMPFGGLILYHVDDRGFSVEKNEKKIDTVPPPA